MCREKLILYCEDNEEFVVRFMKRHKKRARIMVIPKTDDVLGAVKKLKEEGKVPDLILMDVYHPRGKGSQQKQRSATAEVSLKKLNKQIQETRRPVRQAWESRGVSIAETVREQCPGTRIAFYTQRALVLLDPESLSRLAGKGFYWVIKDETLSEESEWNWFENIMGTGKNAGIVVDEKRVSEILGKPSDHPQYKHDIFVVMPFAKRLYPVFNTHIKGILNELGLTGVRADEVYSAKRVLTDIWSGIYASYLIIGDCTGRNPNVLYELGLAHAIGKPTILITQKKKTFHLI